MAPVGGARGFGSVRDNWGSRVSPMHQNSDLEVTMARYQQGDLAAATELVHRLSPQLHRFFLVQFASRSEADDLLQETWLRVHKVRHTYRAGEPLINIIDWDKGY